MSMNKLTIAPAVETEQINDLELALGMNLSDYTWNLIITYGGQHIIEDTFIDATNIKWKLLRFMYPSNMVTLSKEYYARELGKKLPFALGFESHYCLSFEDFFKPPTF